MGRKLKTLNEMKYFDFTLQPGKELVKRISINSSDPFISIITIYDKEDNEEYMIQTLNSLKNQTFPFWEWIVITNNESIILNEYAKKDKRIKIYTYEYKNISQAKQYGATIANCDLLFLLNKNNLLDKTMLECGFFTMMFNKEAVFAYSRTVEFGAKDQLYNIKLSISEEKKKNIIPSDIFVRKDKFLEDYLKLGNDTFEDWYLWLTFLSKGYIPLKMGFYGFWQRNTKENKKIRITINDKLNNKLTKVIDKINSKTEIIQFDDSYEVDYKNVPEKIDLKRKPIVPDNDVKRILFILPWSVVGGADIFNLNLIKGLKQKNYEISVITTQKCDYALRQGIEQYVEEYFDLTTFLKRKDWASFIEYIIRSRRIKLVFLSNSYYGYYALPWLKYHFKNIPFVDYIHAENWTLRNGGFPKDSNAVANYLDATYTCTAHLRDVMYKTMKRSVKNVKPIYIGTDASFYDPNIPNEKDEELQNMYKGKKVILFPSRIVHYKRPLFAIKVLQNILKTRKDVRLAIAGDGAAFEDVKKYISDNNLEEYVTCFGMQQDVRPFYKVANVTLICSLREGLTLTTYESLSMGVPIVSSDVGGQAELIGEDCGMLIKPYQTPDQQFDFNYSQEEINEYTKAILNIIDNYKKEDIKDICRNKILEHFTINKMVSNLDKEFTKLIESGSKIDKDVCKNIGLAERYLLVHSVLESKDEKKK